MMASVRPTLWAAILVPFLSMAAPLPGTDAPLPGPSLVEPPGLGKQILGGTLFGAGGLLAGGTLGAGLFTGGCYAWSEDCGFAGLFGALVGGAFGFAGAFPYGTYRFGNDEHHSGSLPWTYASTLLGAAAGFGGWALATGLEDEDHWFQASMLGMAGAPIGALIGFNLTRGPRGAALPRASLAPTGDGGWSGRLTWSLR